MYVQIIIFVILGILGNVIPVVYAKLKSSIIFVILPKIYMKCVCKKTFHFITLVHLVMWLR